MHIYIEPKDGPVSSNHKAISRQPPKYHGQYSDARWGPDLSQRALPWLGGGSWLFLLVALLFLNRASPELNTMFHRLFGIAHRTWWDVSYLYASVGVVLTGLGLSGIGLLINFQRLRRKEDRINIPLAVALLLQLMLLMHLVVLVV